MADESLVGFITRLTEINNYETISWLLNMAKRIRNGPGRAQFPFDELVDLSTLSELSGTCVKELKLKGYPKSEQSNKYLVFGHPVSKYMIRPTRPKVCPMCLQESNYYRKIWDIVLVTVCPVHKNLLLDKCLKCGERIEWRRRFVSVCTCKFDWRSARASIVEDTEVEIARQIHHLCGLSGGEYNSKRLIETSPLCNLGLENLASALLFIGSQFVDLMDSSGKKIGSNRWNSEIHTLLIKAFKVFEHWPENYYRFLDWRRGYRNGTQYTRGLRKDFRDYEFQFYNTPFLSHLKFMHDEFEEYLLTYWDGGYTSPLKRLSQAGHRSKYVSRKEAERVLRIDGRGINSLLEVGKLKGIVRAEAKTRFILIERGSLIAFKNELDNSLSLCKTARLLSLTRSQVKDLIQCGLLNPLRGPSVDGCSNWSIRYKEVEELLNTTGESVPKKLGKIMHRMIGFLPALRKLRYVGVEPVQFLQAIIKGEIVPRQEIAAPGFQRFLFSERDIMNYGQQKLRLLMGEVCNASETAGLLNISADAAYTLMKAGILAAQKRRFGNRDVWLVRKEDIEVFKSNYVSLSELANEIGTSTVYLLKMLVRSRIKPMPGAGTVGLAKYFFKKSEIDFLALSDLVRTARSNRANESILCEKQAAKTLKLSEKELERLVESGTLKPMKKRAKGGTYFFSTYAIEKYRKRDFDYTGLVSSAVAAQMLGENSSTFYRKYVHTGRLKPLKAKGRRSNLYFKRGDVEALISLTKELIRSREAAAILRVHNSCIYKMTAAGKLHPVRGPYVDGYRYNLYLRRDIEKLRRQRDALAEFAPYSLRGNQIALDNCREG